MMLAASRRPERIALFRGLLAALALCLGLQANLYGQFTLQVQRPDGSPVAGFRWLLEENTTYEPVPGVLVADSTAVRVYNSHAPVVDTGHVTGSSVLINIPTDQRYFLSVLPDSGHTLSGAAVAVGQTLVTVTVNPTPIPTAQISVLAFHDVSPINNAPEVPIEQGLQGFTVMIHDPGGLQLVDAYGNPLETLYAENVCVGIACTIDADCPVGETCILDVGNCSTDAAGGFVDCAAAPPECALGQTCNAGTLYDTSGAPWIAQLGDGVITTNFAGEAQVRNIAPGMYGIQVIPPPMPVGQEWIQTNTLEGKPVIDAWVKAGEPPRFVELGPAAYHVFYGFVQAFDNLASVADPGDPLRGSVTGKMVFNHFSAPPATNGFFSGPPVEDCWVGINEAFTRTGIYTAPCNPDSTFTITDIPEGTYQLVWWDKHLDAIFGFAGFTIPDTQGNWDLNFNDVLAFRWFGTLEGNVFYDADADGFRDPGEIGIPFEEVLLRFRDGSIYAAAPTDLLGNYVISEVFPFFKWLIAEVGFLTLKDTGFTNIVDAGGEIQPDNGWTMPSRGKLNPQQQFSAPGACAVSGKQCFIDAHCDVVTAELCVGAVPLINPNTGNNLSRTESGGSPGDFLLQSMFLFLNQTNIIDFGKISYQEGESGGISGIVFYATTRAEDDPAYAAGEPWEPGIPRVQVNLYQDANFDYLIDDLDGDLVPTLADVDNYPLGWFDDPNNPAAKGAEDVDRDGDGIFDPGDAIQITHTDSFDDNKPTGCIQNLPVVHGQAVPECMDNFGTWNQVRPGVFDGGYAIASHFPGGIASGSAEVDGVPAGVYIVEAAAPKGYEILKEEDKNVDYGEDYTPGGVAALPPPCVGDLHTVPPFLTLFGDVDADGICDPGQECVDAPFAGTSRPLCDRKSVIHSGGQNTAAEFFMFTHVPKAARGHGFINNDFAAEFDTSSPIFGEKQAPSWLPISFQDFAGNEITRTYCDEWGAYEVLLPSTFTVNVPAPTGVSANMVSFVLNHPGPIPDPNNPGQVMVDPFFNSSFSQSGFTFNFQPGTTRWLDTPVIPVAGFAGFPNGNLDVEPPDGEPVIYSVMGPIGGPVACTNGDTLTITSMGPTDVPNPAHIANGICVALVCAGGSNPGIPCTTDAECVGTPITITRDFGFGWTRGEVTVDGSPLTITSWTDSTIVATVDTALISTGRLSVTRGDTGRATQLGVKLHVGNCASVVYISGGGTWPVTKIQDAIDLAVPGTTIVVGPGTYKENPIIYKNVKLQGSGAGSTFISGNPLPNARVQDWHDKIGALIAAGELIPLDIDGAALFFEAAESPCIFLQGKPTTFDAASPGLIDGFTLWGAVAGGGIYVSGYADYCEISNNRVTNNQGTYGGGIVVGQTEIDTFNEFINIHHNRIAANGGVNGGGGMTIFQDADSYTVADNLIIGNFSRFSGAGIAHLGLSDGGRIERNEILFNEVFYGVLVGGDGGGIHIGEFGVVLGAGAPPVGAGRGTGSISIVGNTIRGNLAGSGSGGGIRALMVNGEDSNDPDPANWYKLNIFNNVIVNNVATFRGGAIALQDAAVTNIIHNTIANNDCTATAALAFPPGNLQQSLPQGGGISANPHSTELATRAAAVGLPAYSDPVLMNNILRYNRSFYWDATINGAQGGLVPNIPPHWDEQVVAGGNLNPQFCILSDTLGYDPSNIAADPSFTLEYLNNPITAALIDEGGNFISVRYRELDTQASDYHAACCSAAIDAGTDVLPGPYADLDTDLDGEPRPRVISATRDIGADEVVSLYDVDSDCSVGPGDFAFLVPCWLQCETDVTWPIFNCSELDFDCSGCVDPGDFAFFVNAWQKPCDDATLVFPACRAAPGQILMSTMNEPLPPASREVVESFGLTYPEESDTRFMTAPDPTDRNVEQPKAIRNVTGREERNR